MQALLFHWTFPHIHTHPPAVVSPHTQTPAWSFFSILVPIIVVWCVLQHWSCKDFYLLHITLLGLWGGAKPSLLSWDFVTVVTANSILSLAQSAGSACAREVEAVPSGATVGPNRYLGKRGLGTGKFSPPPRKNSHKEWGRKSHCRKLVCSSL